MAETSTGPMAQHDYREEAVTLRMRIRAVLAAVNEGSVERGYSLADIESLGAEFVKVRDLYDVLTNQLSEAVDGFPLTYAYLSPATLHTGAADRPAATTGYVGDGGPTQKTDAFGVVEDETL